MGIHRRASLSGVWLAQDTPESHADPAGQSREGARVAVLEVLGPATQGAVDVGDDQREACPAGALGLSPYRLLELRQALPAGPSQPALEVISQEVKSAALRGIDNVG